MLLILLHSNRSGIKPRTLHATVRTRYAFLADLDADEYRWTQCNGGDRHEVETTLATIEPTKRHP
ncbi:hypothetical protein [Raineyella sp. W15-4]|uniref:hypothetical protein n=1 Tax=Raineyella sp. W15-4 TaxID=3081651 RepID=UPI002955D8AC|nr:hypothetical protein [Raineyella sp. W15-4]WOQ18112.1 hypothetical protein R0145_05250 [Raineyella sp. W15-4]